MEKTTRRVFLKSAPLAAAAVAMPTLAHAIEVEETANDRFVRLMTEVLGIVKDQGEVIAASNAASLRQMTVNSGSDRFCGVLTDSGELWCRIDPGPRKMEYQGDGEYEVRLSKTSGPIFIITRWPSGDSVDEGRCFQLCPRDALHLGTRYVFEDYLRTILIRKI